MTVNAQVFQEEQVQPFFYITVAVPTEATSCSKAFAKEDKAFEQWWKEYWKFVLKSKYCYIAEIMLRYK